MSTDTVRVRGGEEVLASFGPHWVAVFLRRPVVWLVIVGGGVAGWLVLQSPWWLAAPVALLGWEMLEVASRRYMITDARVTGEGGVLRRVLVDVRLDRVQHAALEQNIVERVLNLGSIGFASSGTGGYDVVWTFVERPDDVLARCRVLLDAKAAAVSERPGHADHADRPARDDHAGRGGRGGRGVA